MTVEWVVKHKIPALLLLDSEKAFDRVEHAFIWATLEKNSLGGTTTKIIKGLLSGATSKVHVNNRFIEEIMLTRGIR